MARNRLREFRRARDRLEQNLVGPPMQETLSGGWGMVQDRPGGGEKPFYILFCLVHPQSPISNQTEKKQNRKSQEMGGGGRPHPKISGRSPNNNNKSLVS